MKPSDSSTPGKPTAGQRRGISRGSARESPRSDPSSDNEHVPDIPEPTPEEFARAVARRGLKPHPGKQQITLRLDADVLAWFRAQGPGYQSRINALLREYMRAHTSGAD